MKNEQFLEPCNPRLISPFVSFVCLVLIFLSGSGCYVCRYNRVFPSVTWYWSQDARNDRQEKKQMKQFRAQPQSLNGTNGTEGTNGTDEAEAAEVSLLPAPEDGRTPARVIHICTNCPPPPPVTNLTASCTLPTYMGSTSFYSGPMHRMVTNYLQAWWTPTLHPPRWTLFSQTNAMPMIVTITNAPFGFYGFQIICQ